MAHQDKLEYFDARVRAEPTRMLYALAGQKLTDERVGFPQWPSKKPETPLGSLPLLTTKEGVICHSNVISRHVAKKFGLVSKGSWEETLNDIIVETMHEHYNAMITKVHPWKVFKRAPAPENSEKVLEDIKADLMKRLKYIKSIAQTRGKKFLISDKIELADVWLYAGLELSAKAAFPDIMAITPWVKEFTSKFESDEKMKKYLANRSASSIGI